MLVALAIQVTFYLSIAVILFVGNLVVFGEVFPNLFNSSWVSMAAGLFAAIVTLLVDFLSLVLVAKFVSKKLKKGIQQ